MFGLEVGLDFGFVLYFTYFLSSVVVASSFVVVPLLWYSGHLLEAPQQKRQSAAIERRKELHPVMPLLLDHFRKLCEPAAFYSIPKHILEKMYGGEACAILQSGSARKSKEKEKTPDEEAEPELKARFSQTVDCRLHFFLKGCTPRQEFRLFEVVWFVSCF